MPHLPPELLPGGKCRHNSHRKLFPVYKELSMHLLQTKKSTHLVSTLLGSIPWNHTNWNWNSSKDKTLLLSAAYYWLFFKMWALWHEWLGLNQREPSTYDTWGTCLDCVFLNLFQNLNLRVYPHTDQHNHTWHPHKGWMCLDFRMQ